MKLLSDICVISIFPPICGLLSIFLMVTFIKSNASFSFKVIVFYALSKRSLPRGAWLGQWVEHVTLDLRVVDSSTTLGIEISKTKQNKTKTSTTLPTFRSRRYSTMCTYEYLDVTFKFIVNLKLILCI